VSTEIYNFLLAGKDTTMNMVQMAIYYLTKDKILYDRVVADVRGKPKDYESINSLRVLDGFIKEVLRVYGPALGLFTRVASENIDLGPLHIKKGTYLNIGTVYNHFNPKYFPDPYKIDPDR
jgi:cytochrome P450/NADPH-cytochrome P450 reductase